MFVGLACEIDMVVGDVLQAASLKELYKGTRHDGLGPEVKRRILMGTYALSAGFYDAYYKRAQQVLQALTGATQVYNDRYSSRMSFCTMRTTAVDTAQSLSSTCDGAGV